MKLCGFNRSMQHLISKYREEDVEHEVSTKNLLHRRTKVLDVGSLAERRLPTPIAQLFDRHHTSVRRILAESGGIHPEPLANDQVNRSHWQNAKRSHVD